jgi:hypothetical protein
MRIQHVEIIFKGELVTGEDQRYFVKILPPQEAVKYLLQYIKNQITEVTKVNPVSAIDEKEEIFTRFVDKIMYEMKPLDPEFSKTVDEHFWELI